METTGNGSTSLVRRQLGRRLRRLREEAGKSHDDVVAARIAGRTKIWKIETGRAVVKHGDVLALARLYCADNAITDQLVRLADATRVAGFEEDAGAGVPGSPWLFADLEAGAAVIAGYSSELVIGLLQTSGYTRALMEAGGSLTADEVAKRVAYRRRRQRAFFERPRPGRLDVVMTAGAMSVQVGQRSIMEEQMAHLLAVDERDEISIRVVPFECGVHRMMLGPFTILDFFDADDPALVYTETVAGSRYIERADQVARIRAAFAQLSSQAVPVREYLDGRP